MTVTHCPSLASMLVKGQQVTHRSHQIGWIETPDGRHFQPRASAVQFIPGLSMPFMSARKRKPRWFARLMGIFA
ncbi:hypothetical protein C9426_10020 [Serratia sp. S1B]|nr:hypothetical protein C9426_10020 [Serratia sp. S1B]